MGEDIPANSNCQIMEAHESMEWNEDKGSSAMLDLSENKTKQKGCEKVSLWQMDGIDGAILCAKGFEFYLVLSEDAWMNLSQTRYFVLER